MWNPNTDGVTAGYLIFYGTSPNTYQPANGVDAGNATEFQLDLTPGVTYYFRVRAYDANNEFGPDSAEFSFVVPNAAPVLTNPGTQHAAIGSVVSRQLIATDDDDDPLTFTSVSGLPPGLTMSSTGRISGTVTGGAATYRVTATVSDGRAQDSETFDWIVGSTSTLTVGDVSIVEGNSGTSVATFTVTLSPVSSQTVTVNYATSNGTATTSNNDYTAASGTLTFTPGSSSRTISVTVRGDTTVEPNETFFVNLSGVANAQIGDAQAVGTITNDDGSTQPTLSINDVILAERNSGTSMATFTVSLSPANSSQTVTVNYATSNGTATTSNSDYTAASGTLTFSPGVTSRTVNVSVRGDTTVEPNETFFVTLSGASNATIGRAQGTATISNDDALQSVLSINNVSVTEGNSGTATATFTVTLSPVNSAQTVTVNYATANGTASTSNNDYTATSGTLTFAAGTSTQTISVPVRGDTTVESNETFVVNLSNASNATISDSQGTGTIVNDDTPSVPTVTLTSSSVAPGGVIQFAVSGGPGNRMDWVTLTSSSAGDSNYVDWSYLNGTKSAPSSGTSSATLQFNAPSTPGTYNIRFFADNRLTNKLATSAPLAVASQPALSIGNATVTEGNSGTTIATFTVTLSPVNTSQTVTVNYATADGTATAANNDYTAATGTLTFPPSTATRTISVAVNGDTVVEANEAFLVNLSGASNAVIGDPQGTGTITNDDGASSAPTVTLTSSSVQPGGTIQFSVSGGPGNRMDWVTLTPVSNSDSSYVEWSYLNGSKSAPGTGLTSADLEFRAPTTPGAYNIRFFADNRLSNRLATSATVNVANQPTLTIGDVNITEGNSGTAVATFTVTLSPVNTSQTVTVNYATSNGTATASSDYVAASGTLSFSPSTATRTISVTVNGDTTIEPDETFFVNLSNASNAAIGDGEATGTIVNDDGSTAPTVSVSSTSVRAGRTIQFSVSGGPGNSLDWVTLTPVSAGNSAYVNWNYLNGSKTAPSSGRTTATLQFTAPTTPGTYNIRFFGDNRLSNWLATSVTITVTP